MMSCVSEILKIYLKMQKFNTRKLTYSIITLSRNIVHKHKNTKPLNIHLSMKNSIYKLFLYLN